MSRVNLNANISYSLGITRFHAFVEASVPEHLEKQLFNHCKSCSGNAADIKRFMAAATIGELKYLKGGALSGSVLFSIVCAFDPNRTVGFSIPMHLALPTVYIVILKFYLIFTANHCTQHNGGLLP